MPVRQKAEEEPKPKRPETILPPPASLSASGFAFGYALTRCQDKEIQRTLRKKTYYLSGEGDKISESP
jgi:hypothetical protein